MGSSLLQISCAEIEEVRMKIIALVENTTASAEYRCKHGLSLYIETEKHKILFDLGSDRLFAENAKKLNIDITEIDTVVISHGHKDHGGALKEFMAINSHAKIYIKKEAFEPHYIKVLGLPFHVGLDEKLLNEQQIILTDDTMLIDEELFLFSNVKPETFVSKSNRVLYSKKQGYLQSDDFDHEQSLILTVNGQSVLVSGCSHAGIVNIVNKAESLIPTEITTVIGGFHLYNPPTKKYESNEMIDTIAVALAKKNFIYYTCHCTGMQAYKRMKKMLGKELHYLSTGTVVML